MKRESAEVWRGRVESWTQSGMSGPRFAEKIGVNVHTLRGWKLRLSEQDGSKPKRRRKPSFAEILPGVLTEASASVEAVLPDGTRVRVNSGAEIETLVCVLDCLRGE